MISGIWNVAIILLFAKSIGSLFAKLKLPSSIGEILAGVILFMLIPEIANSQAISILIELGITFSILLTMLTIDFSFLEKSIEKFSLVQIASASIGLVILLLVFHLLKMDLILAVIFLACIIGSSTAIALRSLLAIDALNSKEGQIVLGLQIINSMVEIILVSLAISTIYTKKIDFDLAIKLTFILIGVFVVSSRIGTKIINSIFYFIQKIKLEEILLASTILIALLAGAFTEKLGLTSFVGVMLIGILVSKTSQSAIIGNKLKELGESFFIPIFFASLGFGANLLVDFNSFATLVLSIFLLRFFMFLIPLKIFKFSTEESIKITSGFIPMSAYGLIVLSIATKANVFTQSIYSLFVASYILINMISPLLIKLLFKTRIRKRIYKKKRFFGF
ncbi:MAG: cation:proton antiporter [Candidatus Aenigmatarchaeota archaeon]|nr:cation:proton antiporter [Candidatus Aenigmarchaeota archaeon]